MWSTLTIDEIALSVPEKAALDAIDASQRTGIVDQEIAAARGKILAGGFPLGADGTVPDQVIPDLAAIIRWRWLTTFPHLQNLQTKEREKQFTDAQEAFDQISRGKVRIESPVAGANPLTGQWNSENKIVPRSHPVPPPSTQFQSDGQTSPPYANPTAPSDN